VVEVWGVFWMKIDVSACNQRPFLHPWHNEKTEDLGDLLKYLQPGHHGKFHEQCRTPEQLGRHFTAGLRSLRESPESLELHEVDHVEKKFQPLTAWCERES